MGWPRDVLKLDRMRALMADRGLDATGILASAAAGKVEVLVLLGADPLADHPDRELAARALAGVRTVIATDLFLTESSSRAHVVFPAARPAMAVLGMLMFVQAWNDFLWPFLVLTQTGNPTVQVAVAGLGRGYTPDQSLIMAGALLGTLPLLLVFAIFGKQIVGGIMQGAVKG